MLQFGMPTLIENRTLEDNIALCKELGLSFVELNMNFPEYQIDKMENIDWFYKKADDAGIYYTIHLDENMNIADFNPLVREAYLETVRRTIEVAKHFVNLKDKYEKKAIEKMLQSHCFVLTWDIGHSKATGEIDTPYINAHKDKLCHFHIHDGRENPPKDHLALGDGETNLIARLNKAKECNARCVLETKTIEALKRSVEWLKSKE